MANLVDDYKNMIPGGIMIREGEIELHNEANPAPILDVYEGLIANEDETSSTDLVNGSPLYFAENVTQSFLVFKLNVGSETNSAGLSASSFVFNSISYETLNNSNELTVYPFAYSYRRSDGAERFPRFVHMKWLVLRIT